MLTNFLQQPMDRRCRKTKSAICGALLELICEKPLEQVTVSELARAADVNRKTFYNHYTDVHAVMDEIQDGFAQVIFSLLHPEDMFYDFSHPERFFTPFAAVLEDNLPLFRMLLRSGQKDLLVRRLQSHLREILQVRTRDLTPENYQAVGSFINFISGGVFLMFESWILDDEPVPLTEMANLCSDFVRAAATSLPTSPRPVQPAK